MTFDEIVKMVTKACIRNFYTGRFATRTIKYVLRNVPEYGLKEGYCIIGW